MTRKSLLQQTFIFAGLFLACAAGDSAAQEGETGEAKPAPPAFPTFEARRVAAPKPGTPPKITIQIQEPLPQALVRSDDATSSPTDMTDEIGRYGWFWQRVPIGMEGEATRNRLDQALTALRTAQPPVSTPGLKVMQNIIQQQAMPILIASADSGVSPALVLAVIAVESGGDAGAVSSAGATGLMQLMPDTAARFGVQDALHPEQNIRGGIKYLDWLLKEFSGDAVLALAGYNAGEGAVRTHQGVPPFAETRDYVPKVLAAYQMARALCLSPPELISDGCVFRQMK